MEDVVKKKKKKFPPQIVKGKKIAPIAVKEKKNSPLTQTSCSPPGNLMVRPLYDFGGCKWQRPLTYENFVFCKLNMHNFRPFLV